MISAGNDIICLKNIDITRTNQPRFYSKILTPSEKALYDKATFAALPFEVFVWLLWSVKESAYKYLKRIDNGLTFIPVKFVVTHLQLPFEYILTNLESAQIENKGFEGMPLFKAVINIGPNTLYSSSLVYTELIVSVVNGDENFEGIYWGVKAIDETGCDQQSAAVRAFLLSKLAAIFSFNELTLRKDANGIPVLLKNDRETSVPISLSHHGKFIGYSFQLPDLSA
jgi:phosphopantetheinyl transferase (holo-ACP synthase)